MSFQRPKRKTEPPIPQMSEKLNCYDKILANYEKLSSLHKKIADYIVSNIHEAVFFSVTKLAKSSGISEATIVRFAKKIGYEGFMDFKQDLVTYFKEFMKIDGRIRQSIDVISKARLSYEELTRKEIQFLESSIRSIDDEVYYEAIRAICGAETTYIFGNDLNVSLANDLCYRLSRFKLRATSTSISGHSVFEKLLLINSKDIAIIFDFYKPSIDFRRLMDILEEKQVPVILITDTRVPPMLKSARIVLYAERGPNDLFNSQVVPVAVSNALVVGVAYELGDNAVEALKELSEMHKNYSFNQLEEFSL
jgi:DNA-binding MurR/RpiR family transcriptional regulator